MNKLKFFLSVFFITLFISTIFNTMIVEASNRTTIYNKGEWTVYLDTPDNAKPYYHLHFYKNRNHVYCLRLDNFKYCDGKDNKDIVPRKVMEKVMEHRKVQSAVKHHNPDVENSSAFKLILKIGAVTISAILIVLAFLNVFTGPADDAVAWAAFLKALAW